MQARYYDPVIGRFYSNDPVGYTSENPVMSFNRYMYVNNNPYKYTDPDSELLQSIYGAIAGGVGGYVSSGEGFVNTAVGVVSGAIAGAVTGSAGISCCWYGSSRYGCKCVWSGFRFGNNSSN